MKFPPFHPSLNVKFADAEAIRKSLAYLCLPADKTPVEAADEGLWISDGTDVTKFMSSQTPYMREPMNCLSRRIYEAVIVVGPARSGKTKAMVEGWVNYAVTQAPGDMLLIYSTKTKANDMSKIDLARCFASTQEIAKLRTGRKADDNITAKRFKNGMNLKLDSATETSLSASTYRYAGCTDYDRSDDSVGEEGSKFQLMLKRIQNAKSSGMAMAESSPGRVVRMPKKVSELGEHESQPCSGIAELYNQGDRRRFYWQCPDCEAHFLPYFEVLKWEELDDYQEASQTAYVECPRCCFAIKEAQKRKLNMAGQWFREGAIDQYGNVVEDELLVRKSKWATFWFEGVVAAYQNWESLVYRYLNAQQRFDDSGDEESLKSFFNVDIGRSYIMQGRGVDIGAHELMERAESYSKKVVPTGGRFLMMSIDVQGGKNSRFIVQAHVYGEGLQRWVIDRFEILTNPNRDDERVNPALYPEDWDVLIDQVITKTYPLADGSGRSMKPVLTVCDSGGSAEIRDGKTTTVTEFSYQFYKRLKEKRLEHLFRLAKGASRDQIDLVKEVYPDKRSQHAHGEIPLLLLSPNRLKNRVATSFEREEFGARFFHLPAWAEREWFEELTAEFINEQGVWECPPKTRNESFDLCAYAEAGMHYKGGDDIDWSNPPAWAADWQFNSNVCDTLEQHTFERKKNNRRRHSRGIYG
ncbi:terminase gpA endonuclease subunit [Vibrio splendidus]|uniref:terminase gpA endonuclease subunit n=1 Tax=Vibrio splendidus TaxID=29497 RepID=UPI000C859088|nr:terminase gpA endonuclease subunit [Vibrio splendidus]PMI49562.1 DNA packaging protein [Vibrio splendidus]